MSEDCEMEVTDSEASDEDWEDEEDDVSENGDGQKNAGPVVDLVYLPGKDEVKPNKLVCDESAYIMLHKASTGAPCLSFDVIRDPLGENRDRYPMTNFIVCGTQSERSHTNSVIVMKMFNMFSNSDLKDQSDEDDDGNDEMEEQESKYSKEPVLHAAHVHHPLGAVNRIRATTINETTIAASWCERGIVYIWDLTTQLDVVNDEKALAEYHKKKSQTYPPLFSFNGHNIEGFAMDWSRLTPGNLLTGDCNKNIHIWKPQDAATWAVDQRPFVGHTASVEDIQWSPNEATVFSSCSVDKSIRVWDIRAAPSKACMLTCADAHETDVNVISWNKTEPFLVSGGDDGIIKIWDLRHFKTGKPVALFKHHTSAITSVEWHPTDGSVFGAAGSDDQITLWDLAVEKDEEDKEDLDVPPQLLFIHQGQSEIKEIHWHPQCTGVMISTAHSGFNVFRTISV